jgi:beta-lactamase regulating signal transducer with metallopeptidase domain
MTRDLLIRWAAVGLTVSLKCILIYLIAWTFAATFARHRPAWRSFLWMAVIASFPCLTILEAMNADSSSLAIALLDDISELQLILAANAYMGVCLVLLGLVIHSAIRLNLLRSYSGPLDVSLERSDDDETAAAVPTPCLLLGTGLYTNGQLSCPTSFGILWPSIIIPEPPVGTIYGHFVRAALIHELIKTLRFDALWTLLARLVQCVYFIHPLVWLAFRQYCLAREQVCDRWTVRTTTEVSEYEVHLLAVGRSLRRRVPMSIDAPMDWTGPRGMRARIRDLQNYEWPESLPPWPTVAATVGWMLLLAVVAGVTVEPTAGGYGPAVRLWSMLMGAAGAFTAGGILAVFILIARSRRACLTPPIDGLAGRSRQTLADCVLRLEREWQDIQTAIGGTARRLEPLLLVLIVMAATVGFWWMAAPSRASEEAYMRGSIPLSEASFRELQWPSNP